MRKRKNAYNRLNEEYKYLCLISQGDTFDKIKMAELIGKISFAAEYKLITLEEWEFLFSKIYKYKNNNGV